MQEEEKIETWNKKRIIVSFALIILLAVGAFFLKGYILSSSLFNSGVATKDVKGASTVDESAIDNSNTDSQPLPDVQKIVQEKLDTVKQELTNINVLDVASSSPQFQKIINDIQALQQYPHDQLKNVCKMICGN